MKVFAIIVMVASAVALAYTTARALVLWTDISYHTKPQLRPTMTVYQVLMAVFFLTTVWSAFYLTSR